MSPQVVAITGVSGYFGRVLMPLLESDPEIERVIGIDRISPQDGRSWQKLEFHQQDIRDPQTETLLAKADTLVHLAFQLMRLPDIKDIDAINIEGTQRVLNAAGAHKLKKIVITGSVVCYGFQRDNPIPLQEDSPLRPNPDHYYSRAKAENEVFLDGFVKENPDLIVTRLRPCTVIGPNADPAQMAQLRANTLILVKGYNPLYQLLHEEDLAAALHMAIVKDVPGIYNIVSDEPRTMRQLMESRGGHVIALPYPLVRLLLALMWRLGISVFAPEWTDLSRYSIAASNDKAKAIGWKPKYTTPEAYLALLSEVENGG